MHPNRIKLIQTLGELLIPLLGYFFWHWNFYFIALFYFLDLIANTCFLPLKLSKIDGSVNHKTKIMQHYMFYVLALIGIFCLGVLLSGEIIPNFDLKAQSVSFFMLKDMGIAQGFFLIPLVFYAGYMQYKMEFLMPKKFSQISVKALLKKHFTGLILCLGFLGISLGIAHFLNVPEIVAVLVLVCLTSAYSFWMKRN